MVKLERLYDASPIWLQNAMVTAAGFRNSKSRYGKAYFEYKEFLRKFDTLPLAEKQEYQRQELVKFVRYAYENSRFYRELYKDVDISKIQRVEDLKLLPIVDKEILRANADEVFTIPEQGALKAHTGGTTGKSLAMLRTPEDMMKRMAMLDHFKERVGFQHLKMRRATFNGKYIVPPRQRKNVFWRYNHACKQMIYSSFHITEENAAYYVESLNRFKPQALDGFFTCMVDIANYIDRHAIRLDFQPVAIFPTSETLTQPGRELLERVFKCKVYDQYASSEGAPFITECRNQKLHIELSSGVFEHFEEGSDEILVTSFTTHGAPLIRYRIGDSVSFYSDRYECCCGDSSTAVESIKGRSLDFLFTSGGHKIYPFGGFKNPNNSVVKTQFVQDKIGEILVNIVVDPHAYRDDYDAVILEDYSRKFGLGTKVFLNKVSDIPREKSGKFKMIKNNVSLYQADGIVNTTKRVLHFFASLDRGGAESMIMSLYRNIERERLQFDFVVNDSDCEYAYKQGTQQLGGATFLLA